MRTGRKYRKVPFIVLLYGLAFVFLYKYSIHVQYIRKPLSIELDKCSCMRNLTTYNLNITRHFFNYTTCGRDAFFRGPHQKVIAFSFYGNSSSPEHLVRGFFAGNINDVICFDSCNQMERNFRKHVRRVISKQFLGGFIYDFET